MEQSLDSFSFSLCSALCHCISFRQEQFWVKILRCVGGPITQLSVMPMVSMGSIPPFLCITANFIPVGSCDPLISLTSGTFLWLSPLLQHHSYIHPFNFLTSVFLTHFLPHLILSLFSFPPFSLYLL